MSDEKAKPIKCLVRSRESHFDVTLPNYFFVDSQTITSKRILLTDVRLCPDYYSQMAAEHGLDSAEEDESATSIPIKITANISPTIFRNAGCHEHLVANTLATKTTASELMEKFNKFVFDNKPSDFLHVPVFFDWCHMKILEYTEAMMLAYESNLWPEDQSYTTVSHSNVLDKTVRNLPNVNNFKFPTIRSVDVMTNTRARMHLAPNTRIIFSNPYLMTRFGFTISQCITFNRQYIFVNETHKWKIITANLPYFYVDTSKASMVEQTEILNYVTSDIRGDHKIRVDICRPDICTDVVLMEVKKKDWLKNNTALETALNVALKQLGQELNFLIQVSYQAVGKKFKFIFPDSTYISDIKLYTGAELAQRLQYGLVDYITKDSASPEDAVDSSLTYEEKARTLVYDTQIVWITLDQTSCNVTLNSNQEVMCILYPYRDGTMRSSNSDLSHTVKLPNYALGSDYILVRFNLWTFDQESKPVPLKWNTSSTVTGLLRSQKV